MGRYQQMWESLKDEEYRREYSADVGTGLAFQIKLLREKNGWTQEQLAQRTGKQQGTISEWEKPNYGSYTIKTLKSLAAAFDVALIVKFAPFSELVDWNVNLTPARLAPPSFVEESQEQSRAAYSAIPAVTLANTWTFWSEGPVESNMLMAPVGTAAVFGQGALVTGHALETTLGLSMSPRIEKGDSRALAA